MWVGVGSGSLFCALVAVGTVDLYKLNSMSSVADYGWRAYICAMTVELTAES